MLEALIVVVKCKNLKTAHVDLNLNATCEKFGVPLFNNLAWLAR